MRMIAEERGRGRNWPAADTTPGFASPPGKAAKFQSLAVSRVQNRLVDTIISVERQKSSLALNC